MARLIDVDALKFSRGTDCNHCERDCHKDCSFVEYKHVEICEMLRNAPTVDVAPVVHGKWIKLKEAPEWDQRRCSVCGDYFCCQGNFCPNCGAKMDGEQNEN